MKRTAVIVVIGWFATIGLLSCGSSSSSNQAPQISGLKFRAFVSNPLLPSGGGTSPVLEVIDAAKDVLGKHVVGLAGKSSNPGLMVVSPNKKTTLVFSSTGNSIAVVDNSQEAPAQTSGGGSLPSITLPDFTESMLISADNTTAYAAVRNAPMPGQAPGAVAVINIGSATITDELAVPNAHYIVQSHNGNRILAFGDNQDTVTVIVPALIGGNQDPVTVVCPDGTPQSDPSLCDPNAPRVFDHPVWGVFSDDDTKAFIFNCGAKCGGTASSITVLDLTTNTSGASVPLAAATIGLLSGSTLYVAGTPPNTPCGSGTAATSCGTLQTVDTSTLTASAPLLITDGEHNRMELTADGKLFIGARNCTNINISGGEVRGCLSIFDTAKSSVVIPPDNGDVTGIQPITNRHVVYVVEGGELRIYDTTTDKLQATQIDLIGEAVDVKLVDF